MENSMKVPPKIKNNCHVFQQYHFWLYIQKIESRILETYLHAHAYCPIFHNNQEMEATQIFIDSDYLKKM